MSETLPLRTIPFYFLLISVLSPILVQTIPRVSLVFWLSSLPVVCVFGFHIYFSQGFRQSICRNKYLCLIIVYLIVYAAAIIRTSSELNGDVLKDFFRGAVLFATSSLLLWSSKIEKFRDKFILYFMSTVVFISAIAVIFSSVSYYLRNTGNELAIFYDLNNSNIVAGSSLNPDYNMFSITLLMGVLFSLYFWSISKEFKNYLFFALLIGCFFVVGIHTGSRRFLVIFPLLLAAFLLCHFLLSVQNYRLLSDQAKYALRNFDFKKCITSFFVFSAIAVILNEFYISYQSVFYDEGKNALYAVRIETMKIEGASFGLQERFDRWKYAYEIFTSKPAIFLGDFSYRQAFGCHFINCEVDDYPHNFILSGLLFGGVLGAVLTLLIFLYPFMVALQNFSANILFATTFLFVCVVSAFVFISGDSLFAVPVYLISLLIFFASCSPR